MAGLYVHIPFCRKRCPYCSFVSYENTLPLMEEYISAVKAEAKARAQAVGSSGLVFDTVYFGGGTPSLVTPKLIKGLIDYLLSSFAFVPELEISLECNPDSISKELLFALKKAGVNRISLGVQDLTEKGLSTLGRIHSVRDSLRAARLIKDFGFENLSIDLIYCLPGQDVSLLKESLETGVSLEPSHISAYELTVEEGTMFSKMAKGGEIELPGEEKRLELTLFLEGFLADEGFCQYEISNFAKPGLECRHNINYWRCGQYLGLGCGAVSYIGGKRCFNTTSLVRYMEMVSKDGTATEEIEELDREARFRETFVMWLRMTEGIQITRLEKRFGINAISYYGRLMEKMCKNGLMNLDAATGTIKLTDRGRYISNYVLSHFV